MAAYNFTPRKTLAPENQFAIVCPVFGAQTKIASCFALHDLVMRGEPPETRKGCQLAMKACKCPINIILKHMGRAGDDPYHSVEAKVGNLRPAVLEYIAPILVQDKHIEAAAISQKEKDLLLKANENARSGVKASFKGARKPRTLKDKAAEELVDLPSTIPDSTIAAAVSGDMTAAINAAVSEGAK